MAHHIHPQATHTAALGAVSVAYLLVRSSRRSIGLEISHQGLTVRAPLRASMANIESVLHDKTRWVISKLNQRESQMAATTSIQWQHGSSLPYLGGQLQLVLSPDSAIGGDLVVLGPERWALHLPLLPSASASQVRAAVAAWWLRHARDLLVQRLQHFAPMLGVQWRSLRMSNAQTRWGSAKTDGSIMLNWRLLHHRLPVLDYVVIHELSHLRVMDHSPRFWATVQSICPDYAALRAELRQQTMPLWNL